MSSSSPPQRSPAGLPPSQNPRNWRFTWEAQSQIPTLKLYLFNAIVKPATQCLGLKVKLIVENSLLLVSFICREAETSLHVPLPRLLIDHESPVFFRAHGDHIEVKLVLLLPVDHPLVSEFGSTSHEFRPLLHDSDLKKLAALEEVYFYCRSCSTKLTRPLRSFKEMPSVNWQDVADNWFGSCCCSFGGISEKLVTRYAQSYRCTAGVCLLDTAAVIISKDDLVGCEFLNWNENHNDLKLNLANGGVLTQDTLVNGTQQGQSSKKGSVGEQDVDGKEPHFSCEENKLNEKLENEAIENISYSLSCISRQLPEAGSLIKLAACSTDMKDKFSNCDTGCCNFRTSEGFPEVQNAGVHSELQAHQKILLDGFLWNGFVAKSSNISKAVEWLEYLCPHCSCLLGAYPCFSDNYMLDGGVRLFKCHISTSLPVLDSNDLFRCYGLERMFSTQLLESAKEELSFRTVVRDMQTNLPMLQLILLNPDCWCYTGCCLSSSESAARIDMYPTIRLLFSPCSKDKEMEYRKLEEQISRHEVEELYMLPFLIKELIHSLKSGNCMFPPSQASLQGLLLSSLKR